MKQLSYLFTTILLLSNSAYAFRLPENFQAEYRLEKYNTTIANMNMQLIRKNQQFIYQTVTQPYGMAALLSNDQATETSTLYQKDTHAPLYLVSYEFNRKKKSSKNQHIDLSWSDEDIVDISGHYGKKKYTLQHTGILWDRLSVQLALADDISRSIDIKPGHEFSYKVIDKGEITDYKFTYDGHQSIHLGKYHYNTVKLVRNRDSGDRTTIIWLAKELDFTPVKIEQLKKDKLHLNMELVHFTRQKP